MADSHKIVFEGSSYPEVALSPLPEARPHDFPETVSRPSQEKIIGATATPTPTKPKFFTKRRIIILTIAAVIFAAIIGGVAGGAYHAALKKGSQDGIAANDPASSSKPEANQTTIRPTATAALQLDYRFPTAVSVRPGRIDVFGSTGKSPNKLWHKGYNETAWQPTPTSFNIVGSNLAQPGNPGIITRSNFVVDVYVLKYDNAISQKWIINGSWGPGGLSETLYPHSGMASSALEGVAWQPYHADLFSLNQAKKLQQQTWVQSVWGSWKLVGEQGGPSTYVFAPVVLSWPGGGGDVFLVQEKSLEVVHTTWTDDGSASIQYKSIGGICTSRPTAVALVQGRIDLFCRGHDEKLWWTSRPSVNGNWTTWGVVEGSMSILGEPHAITLSPTRFDVYVQTANNTGAVATYDDALQKTSQRWRWLDLGGNLHSPPKAVNSVSKGIHVFGYNEAGALKHLQWNGSSENIASLSWDDLGTP